MPKTVMVVDDSAEMRELLTELLRIEGYDVVTAPEARAALAQLAAALELPGLIILDVMMPVMDGYEFLQAQRCDPRLREIPVVVATAAGALDERALGTRVFRKPLDPEALLALVARHCA